MTMTNKLREEARLVKNYATLKMFSAYLKMEQRKLEKKLDTPHPFEDLFYAKKES